MISKPKLDMKFTKLEDFLEQNEMSLVVEDGTAVIDYMSQSPINSTMRQLINETQRLSPHPDWPSGCFNSRTGHTKSHASICDTHSILAHLSEDFSETGKCNWYTLKPASMGFFPGSSVMAFQVA